MSIVQFMNYTFKKHDPLNNLIVSKPIIHWNNVSRNTPVRLVMKLNEEQEKKINSKYLHSFDFEVRYILNVSKTSRHLFTLYKLIEKAGSVLSLYIAQLRDTDQKFRIVFFQRVDGQNVFVEKTILLDIEKKYTVNIGRIEQYYTFEVLDVNKNPVHNKTIVEGVDEKYSRIRICEGHSFDVAPDDSSSGYFSNLNLDIDDITIDTEKAKKYRYDLFISYCRMSGMDYAQHLYDSFSALGVKVFLDKNEIPYATQEFEDYWENDIMIKLRSSKYFILLMTPGFETRRMIKKEIMFAKDHHEGKKIRCKWHKLPQHRLYLEIEEKKREIIKIDLNKSQYWSFENKCDLFRNLYNIIDEGPDSIIPNLKNNPYL